MRDDELLAAMWRAFQAAEHVGHPDGPMAAILAVVREHDGLDAWQPIETAPHMRKIIVHYRNDRGRHRVVMACFYEEKALEMHDDYEEVGVWDEASEMCFAPAGWYEEHDSDDPILTLGGEPTHWMPLPAPPVIDAAIARGKE